MLGACNGLDLPGRNENATEAPMPLSTRRPAEMLSRGGPQSAIQGIHRILVPPPADHRSGVAGALAVPTGLSPRLAGLPQHLGIVLRVEMLTPPPRALLRQNVMKLHLLVTPLDRQVRVRHLPFLSFNALGCLQRARRIRDSGLSRMGWPSFQSSQPRAVNDAISRLALPRVTPIICAISSWVTRTVNPI